MSRFTRLFVIGLIAEMALVTLAVAAWRWDAYVQVGAMSNNKLMASTFAMLFIPAFLALGALFIGWMFSRPGLRIADDTRRFGEKSLIAAGLLCAGIHLWAASGAVLGDPPGHAFGVRVIEAIAGIFFITNANLSAKTSPPPGWRDSGRWIRATLRTGWVGVAAGLVILAGAIAAPLGSMVWIVGGATLVYLATAVLGHLRLGRKPA